MNPQGSSVLMECQRKSPEHGANGLDQVRFAPGSRGDRVPGNGGSQRPEPSDDRYHACSRVG